MAALFCKDQDFASGPQQRLVQVGQPRL